MASRPVSFHLHALFRRPSRPLRRLLCLRLPHLLFLRCRYTLFVVYRVLGVQIFVASCYTVVGMTPIVVQFSPNMIEEGKYRHMKAV